MKICMLTSFLSSRTSCCKMLIAFGALALALAAQTQALEVKRAELDTEYPISLEIGWSYNFAGRNIADMGPNSLKVDTLGVDFTGLYKLDQHNALNLRFGFASGSDSITSGDDKDKYTINAFSLMGGYRLTTDLTQNLQGFAGINVGVVNTSVRNKYSYHDAENNSHDTTYGFGYSAELGLRYIATEDVDVFVGYQFSGNTARPKLWNGAEPTKHQLYHSIRFGVNCKF